MVPSRIDLVHRAIPRSFRGYNTLATDRLLQDLSDALARATDEKLASASRVDELEARLAEYATRESSLQEALVAGRRVSEDIREAAQKEAQLILETARLKADGILQNARSRLMQIMGEAANAKREKARFEVQLRTVIESHLRLLELDRRESAMREDASGAGEDGA